MAEWKLATLVKSEQSASDIKSLFFEVEDWTGHIAGQHCDIRLTSPEGYSAQRSYSIASAPAESLVEFGIQLLENGEVSPFLWQMKPGEQIEVKGPLGGHFIWKPDMPGPLLLIGGGSGVAPLLSIYKTAKLDEVKFIVAAKTADKIMYYEQFKEKLITRFSSTNGRIDQEFLKKHVDVTKMPMVYVCGPTPFVETVANSLVNLGLNPHLVRTERFG
jgi:ferredoxin-NADP reductase